jgi:GNAT superfamily N-acetyltransferase
MPALAIIYSPTHPAIMVKTQPTPPQPLTEFHDLSQFCSDRPELNQWLQKHALANQKAGASRTFVVCLDNQVIAYYCLAAGSILPEEASGKVRRKMPNPIPAIVLGRLAVDKTFAGQGFGTGLIKDAVQRSLQASASIGARVLLVHALDQRAQAFYLKRGFDPSPLKPTTLMLLLKDVKTTLTAAVKQIS